MCALHSTTLCLPLSHHGHTKSSRLSCFNCQVNLVVLPKIVAENPNHRGIHFLIPNPEFWLANLISFDFEYNSALTLNQSISWLGKFLPQS